MEDLTANKAIISELREAGAILVPLLGQHDVSLLEERCNALERRHAHALEKAEKRWQVCDTVSNSRQAVNLALADVTFQLQNILSAVENGTPLDAQDTLVHLKVFTKSPTLLQKLW